MQPRLRWRRWVGALAGTIVIVGVVLTLLSRTFVPPPKVLGSAPITNDGWQKGSPGLFLRLVTDGSRLYFTEMTSGGLPLAQVSTVGGEALAVATPFPFAILADISPNRSQLLVAGFVGSEAEAPLWLLPVLGGSPHRLGDVRAHDGTWSPQGEQIIYANGSDLYSVKSDGSESRKLVTVAGIPYWPRWSPDGSKLRFTVQDPKSHSTSLWEVSADQSNLHPLLPGWNSPPAECCGNWTADGKYFVFQSSRNARTDI